MHCTRAPKPPSAARPELGAGFDAPLLAALAKNPADRTATVGAFAQAVERAAHARTRPLRSLVADDEEHLLSATCSVLKSAFEESATIEAVPDGSSALEAAERGEFDVALLDLHMPGPSGLEVAAALRGGGFDRAPRIIAMTAVGGAAEWRALRDLGVDALLLKPLDAEQLVEAVKRASTPHAPKPPPGGER